MIFIIIEKPDYDFSKHSLEEVLKSSFTQIYYLCYYFSNFVSSNNRALELRVRNLAKSLNVCLDMIAHLCIFFNIDVTALTQELLKGFKEEQENE